MRTNFCSQNVNKRPRKIEFQKFKITLFRQLRYTVILTNRNFAILRNLKIVIDEIRIVRYIDYGERRKREKSHSFNSQKREKVTETQALEAIHCAGAFTNRKLGIAALQITDLSTPMHRLAEGCRP